MISTFAFRVRNVPAALYKAMGGFATNGVNMTKLESHLGGTFFVTQFYADVDGHPKDTALTLALEEIADVGDVVLTLSEEPFDRRWSSPAVSEHLAHFAHSAQRLGRARLVSR